MRVPAQNKIGAYARHALQLVVSVAEDDGIRVRILRVDLTQKRLRRFLVPGAVRVVHTREHNRIFPARERHKFVFQPRDAALL